ncbi:hypothetical protein AB0365_01435 [Brevibacterium casei]|uniref:hypothetical protein n=1 Tax=Brevibacterium casei TaxID=33889 RepID=UPI00344FD9E9
MKKRLILLAGLGVGYILGSRTGRQSYEKLKAQLQELWTDPKVQETVEKANQSIREKAPAVADAVQTATDKVTAAAQELDGDEDANATQGTGPRSTGSATGSGSTGSATSAGPNRSAAGSTGAAASRSTTGPGSTSSTTGPGSTSSTTRPGSTGSTAGSGPATGASRAGTPTPTPGPKPTPTPKRAEDVLTDPSRSIEDEGPAASANR